MRILVTGGAGFIGYNFIKLYSTTHDIYVIDNYDENYLILRVSFSNYRNEQFHIYILKIQFFGDNY